MRGTGFEPEREMLIHSVRCAFLAGSEPTLLPRSVPLVPHSVRGAGFEPTDPYGTAS